MAKIYADANGNLLRLLQTSLDEAAYGPPPGTAYTLDYDPSTNPTLASQITASRDSWAMPDGGPLQHNGQPVAINPPSTDYTARQIAQAVIVAFRAGALPSAATLQAAVSAVQAGTATGLQVQQVLTLLMRIEALELSKLLAAGAI